MPSHGGGDFCHWGLRIYECAGLGAQEHCMVGRL